MMLAFAKLKVNIFPTQVWSADGLELFENISYFQNHLDLMMKTQISI